MALIQIEPYVIDTAADFTFNGVTVTANLLSGNANLGNVAIANYFTGTLATNAQPNVTSVGTLTGLNVSGNANVGNLGTAQVLASANVTSPQLISNIATGTAPLVVTSTTLVPNLYVAHSNVSEYSAVTNVTTGNFYLMVGNATTGNLQVSSNSVFVANVNNGAITATTFVGTLSGAATTAGTVTTNAQPNITSVGNLTGLTVSNASGIVDVSNTANVSLGAVGNLHISGGSANYVLQTDGSGTLSWVAQTGGGGSGNSISNGNSNVNIATSNGNITMSAVGNANIVVVTGTGANINGYANITGNTSLSGANVSLGNVSNLHITGGSSAQVLTTDGSGTLSWTTPVSTTLAVDSFTGNGVQTTYTLSVTPISTSYVFLAIGGVSQPRGTYSLVGNVVTISSAPSNGVAVEFTSVTGGSGGGGSSGASNARVTGYSLVFGL